MPGDAGLAGVATVAAPCVNVGGKGCGGTGGGTSQPRGWSARVVRGGGSTVAPAAARGAASLFFSVVLYFLSQRSPRSFSPSGAPRVGLVAPGRAGE